MKCLIPALTALALVAPDSARETHAAPAFDPRAWRGTQAGAPTEVLTLYTNAKYVDITLTATLTGPGISTPLICRLNGNLYS